jgi:hypothetical protein
MTIEVGIVPPGSLEKRVVGAIVPGETISFSDFSSGNRDIISAHCWSNNTGGIVFTFQDGDYVEDSVSRAIPVESYAKENLTALIGAGGVFEKDIVMESRAWGRLVLRHLVD